MRFPFFWSKQPKPTSVAPRDTMVVIGVHREEAAFGEAVAKRLDNDHFDILRVGKGLSARRPRPDQLQTYLDNHNRLYFRIADDLSNACRLMIDLHCRQKDQADADLFCADTALLSQCLAVLQEDPVIAGKQLRPIRMISDADLAEISMDHLRSQLFSKPELPEAVWRANRPVYVGLEIYLESEGEGHFDEWLFAQRLIEIIRTVCLADRAL